MATAQAAQEEALDALDDEAFDRPIDETLLEINCSEFVEKVKLVEQLLPWLEEAKIDKAEYVLKGAPVGKRFTLQFLGAPGLAIRTQRRAFGGLRDAPTESGWGDFN